jgi:hypothetical protein
VFFKSKEAECVFYIELPRQDCLFGSRKHFLPLFVLRTHLLPETNKSACCLYIYIYRTHSPEHTQNTFHREHILFADALLGLIQLYTEHILSRTHSIENTFPRGLMLPEKCPVLQQPLCGCAPWPMHTYKKKLQTSEPECMFCTISLYEFWKVRALLHIFTTLSQYTEGF